MIDMLDVAGTVGDGGQDAGRYWLHESGVQQLASQRLNELSPCIVMLAHAVLLVQLSPLKQSLTPINVPFINSIVAAKHLWQTKNYQALNTELSTIRSKEKQWSPSPLSVAALIVTSLPAKRHTFSKKTPLTRGQPQFCGQRATF